MATAGSFKPGVSGNPGGRPKLPEEFREKCRAAVIDLVLPAWIQEVRTRGEHWPKAAEMLAAYGLGKPTQAVEVSGKDGSPIEVSWISNANTQNKAGS